MAAIIFRSNSQGQLFCQYSIYIYVMAISHLYQKPRAYKDPRVNDNFIEQLLRHCGRLPEPKSRRVMDNACFYRTHRIEELCANAGAKLMYLPRYSPDFNFSTEFFSELKAFIRRKWVQ
jgi:transposase